MMTSRFERVRVRENRQTSRGIMIEDRLTLKDVWVVLGQDQAAAEDILCCVDPFRYLSHLSAMDYHGLTGRLPKLLFVTSLPSPQWGRRATESMQNGQSLQA